MDDHSSSRHGDPPNDWMWGDHHLHRHELSAMDRYRNMTAAYIYDPTSNDIDSESGNESLLGSSLDHLNRIVERISPEVSLQTVLNVSHQPGIHSRRDSSEYKRVVPQRGGDGRRKVISATVAADNLNDSAYETFYGDSSDEITPSVSARSGSTLNEDIAIRGLEHKSPQIDNDDDHIENIVSKTSLVCPESGTDNLDGKQNNKLINSDLEKMDETGEVSLRVENVLELERKDTLVAYASSADTSEITLNVQIKTDDILSDNNISLSGEEGCKLNSSREQNVGINCPLKMNERTFASNNDPASSKVGGSEWSPISTSNGLLEIGKYTNELDESDASVHLQNNLFSVTGTGSDMTDGMGSSGLGKLNDNCSLIQEPSIGRAQFSRGMSASLEDRDYPTRLLESESPRKFQDSMSGNDERFMPPPPQQLQAFSRTDGSAPLGGQEDDGKSYFCLHCAYRACKKGQVRKHMSVHGVHLCAHCEHSAVSAEGLESHRRIVHPGLCGRRLCKKCRVLYAGDKLEAHERECAGEKPHWPCTECGKEFKFLSVMKAHIRKWHESGEDDNDSTSVSGGGTAAEKKRVLNGHLRTVSLLSSGVTSEPSMDISGGSVERNSALELKPKLKHSALDAGVDSFCETQNSTMDDNDITETILANPSRTEMVNNGESGGLTCYLSPSSRCVGNDPTAVPAVRPFRCDQCLKQFKTKSTLANHSLQHNAQSPFTCAVEQCCASFKSDKELNVHRERVHGLAPKRYPCTAREDCTMQFAKYGHYKRHMLTHSGK